MATLFGIHEGRSRSRVVTLAVIAVATVLTLWLPRSPHNPTVGLVVPVWGEVTVDNEPLEEGKITFIPDPDKGNTCPFIPTGKVLNGVYEVSTEGQIGAPPGWYKIIL